MPFLAVLEGAFLVPAFFTGAFLIEHVLDDKARTKAESVLKVSQDKHARGVNLEINNLKVKNELLETRLKQANERLRSLDEVILQLKNDLAKYDLQPNERLEVFTNDEYQVLEQRLREWHEHDQKIKHQEELFNVEKASLKDMLKHYKNQWKYQRKQSERILKIHQTLVETIDKQNLNILQRNFIEAKDKGLDNE